MVNERSFWQLSFERYYRLINQTDKIRKIDIFFAFVGRDTEDYLRDLPDLDTLDTVQKLLDKVESRYTKNPNVLCERFHFRNVKINAYESISNFNARLNSMSKYCKYNEYSTYLANFDQIILNSPTKLREKLLMEKDLTLQKLLKLLPMQLVVVIGLINLGKLLQQKKSMWLNPLGNLNFLGLIILIQSSGIVINLKILSVIVVVVLGTWRMQMTVLQGTYPVTNVIVQAILLSTVAPKEKLKTIRVEEQSCFNVLSVDCKIGAHKFKWHMD